MRLSRKNAENIVKELNTVIDQSVNMMNEHGIIIASTDQERVGQIHEGARKIIEQNLEELVIRPEDVDIVKPEPGVLQGLVTSVTFMGVHNEAIVDIGGFKWMIQTTDPVEEGSHIGISLEPDAIHIMKKSKYSGMFGDYSSFSNELDELSNPGGEEEE